MGYEATFDDWLSLLDVRPQVHGLLDGTVTFDDALATVRARRPVYPGVSEDYVAVIDAIVEQLAPIEDLIFEQERQLHALAEAIADVNLLIGGGHPGWVAPVAPGRLLTADERDRIAEIRTEMADAIGEYGQEQEDAIENERAELEDEAESLRDEIEQARQALEEGEDPDAGNAAHYGDDADDWDEGDDG